MIDIHHQHRQRAVIALGPCPFAAQDLIELAAVGQAGEAVGGGQFGQVLFGAVTTAQLAAQQ
ncbi:hypothetical protein D3C86_2170920 [compost metagenome]